VIFYANPCSPKVVRAMTDGQLGFIDTPRQRNQRPPGVTWVADNSCFGRSYPGDEKWFGWLEANAHDAGTCMFATAPDVVGDAQATLVRSLPWLPRIRALGFPAAFVAQDGLENLEVPWDEFDVLFIGGTTKWKLGQPARTLVSEAKLRGKRVHMGRVNSGQRWRYAEHIGCDSADGTFLVFGPDQNLPRLLAWTTPSLFDDTRAKGTPQ
jgi:hypothetical protein